MGHPGRQPHTPQEGDRHAKQQDAAGGARRRHRRLRRSVGGGAGPGRRASPPARSGSPTAPASTAAPCRSTAPPGSSSPTCRAIVPSPGRCGPSCSCSTAARATGSSSCASPAGASRPIETGLVAVFPTGLRYRVLDSGRRVTKWNDFSLADEVDLTERPPGYPAGAPMPADDVGFVDSMMGDIGRRLPIDRRRVYASGFSNGARVRGAPLGRALGARGGRGVLRRLAARAGRARAARADVPHRWARSTTASSPRPGRRRSPSCR